ncbi:MAG: hypothetical protein QM760_23560 [Nibricoccus sp.]
MLKPASVILGLLFLLGGTVGCFMLAGNHPKTLLWFVPGLAMFLLPVGCSIIGFGIRGPAIILRSLGAAIWRSDGTQTAEAARIISALIGYVYGAGGFVFSVSFMTVGNFLPGIIAGGPQHIGEYVAAVTAPVVYSVVFAELMLRPLKHRLG